MIVEKVRKDSLSRIDIESLHPGFGLLKDVNFSKRSYYKIDGILWEVSICADDSYDDNLKKLNISKV